MVNLFALYEDGSVLKQVLTGNVDPYGYVYTKDRRGNEIRLKNVKVYLYSILDNSEKLWEGGDNPDITDTKGEFNFAVEPGKYKLRVNETGYKPVSPLFI